jgi:citrate lyase subunit beta / citryl-CoA lyase
MMKLPITYLFVPGNRPERFDKALAAGADAVILDLEDAVAPDDKARARANVREWIGGHPDVRSRTVVRINDSTTAWFADDLDMLREASVAFSMLPKAEREEQVATVVAALGAQGRLLPIIETAQGLENVESVARAPGVERLVFGTLDYGVDLDLSGDERGLAYPSARIALASRCAGIGSPIAGVTPEIDDDARLVADLAFARAFGFGAKLCIHPRQVGVVRNAMRPTADELAWARRVLAAAERSEGAVQVDGKMVDRPVIQKARAILERAAE